MSLILHRSDGETFEYDGENFYHFGIKGMKWGVRRYQNKDGSLTPLGKERYGTKANFEKQREKKLKRRALVSAIGTYGLAGAAALRMRKSPAVQRGLKAMKNRELAAAKRVKGRQNLQNTFQNLRGMKANNSGAANAARSSSGSSRKLLNAATSSSSSSKRTSSRKLTEQEKRLYRELMKKDTGVIRNYEDLVKYFRD